MTETINALAYGVLFNWYYSGEYWYCNRVHNRGKFESGMGYSKDEAFQNFLTANNLKAWKGNLRPVEYYGP